MEFLVETERRGNIVRYRIPEYRGCFVATPGEREKAMHRIAEETGEAIKETLEKALREALDASVY